MSVYRLADAVFCCVSLCGVCACVCLCVCRDSHASQVFGSSFNTSQFQLFIVPSNASTAACLPDQYAANTDRENAAQVALPFIATVRSQSDTQITHAYTHTITM